MEHSVDLELGDPFLFLSVSLSISLFVISSVTSQNTAVPFF